MDMYDAFTKMANTVSGRVAGEVDEGLIMSSEVNNVVDYALWKETVNIQKALNNSVAPGWQQDVKHQKYDFWMAILDETVEVLSSRHWKWWKGSTPMGTIDWKNVKVELIDIFHFLLSIAIQQDMQSVLFSQIVNMEMNSEQMPKKSDDEFFDEFWQEFLMSVQMKIAPVACVKIIEYWYRIGGTAEELFMEYRIKAALNKVRQEYGYGSSETYSKLWPDENGNKVEDNVMAWKLAQDIELNTDTVKNIQEVLSNYYLKNVAL